MNKEDKKLLIKDLCSRLPYEVIVNAPSNIFIPSEREDVKLDGVFEVNGDFHAIEDCGWPIESVKPYLRPISSITEEEEEEYWDVINSKSPKMPVGEIPSIETIAQCSVIVLDWLLSKGFDIRGLIPKGLAIEAPEEMYKTK